MELRVRNKEIRKVRVADLEDAPWNFRTHPDGQQAALDGAIGELGFYGYPDVYETEDGTLRICDGHLRKSRLIAVYGAGTEIEVNVTDFDEAEARKATLTHDPLAAMAGVDSVKLDELLRDVQTGDEALSQMLADLAKDAGLYDVDGGGDEPAGLDVGELAYRVIVLTSDENAQAELIERLEAEGYECQPLMS